MEAMLSKLYMRKRQKRSEARPMDGLVERSKAKRSPARPDLSRVGKTRDSGGPVYDFRSLAQQILAFFAFFAFFFTFSLILADLLSRFCAFFLKNAH